MAEMKSEKLKLFVAPFNGPVEVGLRALAVLNDAYPDAYSLQKLIIFDYLIVHSDDIPGGPLGLHPQTPHRGGELLVRRSVLQEGLLLYQSRNLINQQYRHSGISFVATERSAAFLDVLCTEYAADLRKRAAWLVDFFDQITDADLEEMVNDKIGEWGAEFEMESVLWEEIS